MPPKVKITKEMILNTVIYVIQGQLVLHTEMGNHRLNNGDALFYGYKFPSELKKQTKY